MASANNLLSNLEDLKVRLIESGSPLNSNNNEVWSIQQLLQVVCAKLLVDYQEFALENGVERDLWNCGFRTTITQLQSETRDKVKGTAEAKDVLNWFLNSASGFYLQLLNQISSANSLDFVFRRKDSVYGLIGGGLSTLPGMKTKDAKDTKNAFYLCQYCLIHLGDLARYRHQAKQAETFYRHAVTVAATSGHPYNQLALLEAGRGNKLASVFLYIRALCVTAPFPGAPSNLIQTLIKVLNSKLRDDNTSNEIKVGTLTRMTKDEYINLFLHFHSTLLLKGDVDASRKDLSRLFSALSMLVATTTLTRTSLVQMFGINLFALHFFACKISVRVDDNNVRKEDEKFIEPKECDGALDLLEDLMVSMLAALLLPIHTMKEPEVVLTYPALPAIRLMFEWILLEDKISSPSLNRKQQIWPGLCSLVNFLQTPLAKFDLIEYEDTPLPEDWDLQGFQPVSKILCRYKFKESSERLTPDRYSLLRAKRLTDLASRFSSEKTDGSALIKKVTAEDGSCKFEASSDQSPPVEEVLDLERLTLHPPHITGTGKKKDKVGILKPQGSLERAKEIRSKDPTDLPTKLHQMDPTVDIVKSEVDSKKIKISSTDKRIPISGTKTSILVSGETTSSSASSNKSSSSNRSRVRTNVALQAILKRNSNPLESKQVKFQTPSPAVSPKQTENVSLGDPKGASPLGAIPVPLPEHLNNVQNQRATNFPPFVGGTDYKNRFTNPTRLTMTDGASNVSDQFTTSNNQFNNISRPSSNPFPNSNQFPSPVYTCPPPASNIRSHEDLFGTFNTNLIGGSSLKNPEVSSFSQHMTRQPQPSRVSPPFATQNLFPSGSFSGTTNEALGFTPSDLSALYPKLSKQWDTKSNASQVEQQQRMVSNFGGNKDLSPTFTGPFQSAAFPTGAFHAQQQQQQHNFDNMSQLQPATLPATQIYGSTMFVPQQNPRMLPLFAQGHISTNDPAKESLNAISVQGLPIGRSISATNSNTQGMKAGPVGADLGSLGSNLTATSRAPVSNIYSPGAPSNLPNTSFWGDKDPNESMYLSQLITRPPPPINTSIPPPPTKDAIMLSQGAFAGDVTLSDQNKRFDPHVSSNTYSLFGPLGDSSSGQSVTSQQRLNSQPQQPSHQSLWYGPSPLQRLLEQKKYSTPK